MTTTYVDWMPDNDRSDFKSRFGSLGAQDSRIRSSDCKDQATIEKTRSIAIPDLTKFASSASLLERVVSGPIEETPKSIAQQLEEIDSEHFTAVEQAINDNVEPDQNFMVRVQCLVAQILAQLNRIAENDREKIEKLKTKYRNTTLEAANLQRDLGKKGLMFAGIAFAAAFLRFASRNEDDMKFAEIFSNHLCPKLGEMFTDGIRGDMTQANGLSSLLLQEYQAKTNKGSSDSANKQEITGMLEKALRLLEAAARSG
jgi:hypothetical protein